jgi:hypothetical protein
MHQRQWLNKAKAEYGLLVKQRANGGYVLLRNGMARSKTRNSILSWSSSSH